MKAPKEYEFIKGDGTRTYDIVYQQADIPILMKMHNATIARPLKETDSKVRKE